MIDKLKKIRDRLYFALYCLPHGDDKKFVENVKRIGKESNIVFLASPGTESSYDRVYLIELEVSYSGFFADYNKLLQYLYFADYYHLLPVVKFPRQFCYAENHPVNGTNNPFEYYYEQPAAISLNDVSKQNHIMVSRKENTYLSRDLNETGNAYCRNDKYIEQMARITAKNIRLNPVLREKVTRDISGLLQGKKTLAVHVRGTDYKHNYNGHPIKIGSSEYLEATVILYEEKNTSRYLLRPMIRRRWACF